MRMMQLDVRDQGDSELAAVIRAEVERSCHFVTPKRSLLKSRPLYALDSTTLALCAVGTALVHLLWDVIEANRAHAETKTSLDSLERHLRSELAKHGIVDIRITAIDNFEEYQSGEELCKVRICSGNGRQFDLWVFVDGDVAVLEMATAE